VIDSAVSATVNTIPREWVTANARLRDGILYGMTWTNSPEPRPTGLDSKDPSPDPPGK